MTEVVARLLTLKLVKNIGLSGVCVAAIALGVGCGQDREDTPYSSNGGAVVDNGGETGGVQGASGGATNSGSAGAGTTGAGNGSGAGATGSTAGTTTDGATGGGSTGMDGTGGTGVDTTGASSMDTTGDPMGGTGGELCSLDAAEVGIIGDSYINILTSEFVPELQTLARAAGALGPNESYVDKSFGGASMAGGGFLDLLIQPIPTQWPQALQESRARGASGIKLLIMDGGGNDVLVNNRACLEHQTESAITQACKDTVQAALDAGSELFEQVARDGAQAVIFFFYPHLPGGGLGGSYPNTMLDYSAPLVRENCEQRAPVPCYFVDLRSPFTDSGIPIEDLIQEDGVHPSQQGAKIMAQEVWKVMQDNCLASE